MTQIEALFVAYTIHNEGFRYGLESKTSFPAITDPVFQGLRKDYIDGVKGSASKIRALIFKRAGIKNFNIKHLDTVSMKFTQKQLHDEDARWEKAQHDETERFLSKMRAELEPNNILKKFID